MTIQTDPQYKLRLPPELHQKLKIAAAENHRSMNAEMVARLQESFEADAYTSAINRKQLGEFAREMLKELGVEPRK